MPDKSDFIRYGVYASLGYIWYHMFKNEWYNDRLSRFGKDIYKIDADSLSKAERKEYDELKSYFDQHEGRQLLEGHRIDTFANEEEPSCRL